MLQFARKNAKNYGIDARYVQGNCMEMPFEDESFDSVISNGSPARMGNPGSRLQRNLQGAPSRRTVLYYRSQKVNLLARYLGLATAKPRAIRPGFIFLP